MFLRRDVALEPCNAFINLRLFAGALFAHKLSVAADGVCVTNKRVTRQKSFAPSMRILSLYEMASIQQIFPAVRDTLVLCDSHGLNGTGSRRCFLG
jgi:hypothetical protein